MISDFIFLISINIFRFQEVYVIARGPLQFEERNISMYLKLFDSYFKRPKGIFEMPFL